MLEVDSEQLDVSEDGVTLLYRNQPFTGVAVEVYPGGRDETEYFDGQKCGRSRRWSDTGILILEESVACNARHGEMREWYPDGVLKLVAQYELGILLRNSEYDRGGQMTEEYTLEPGTPQFETLELMRKSSMARAIEEWRKRKR